jgi:hypothetical protein
MTLTLVVVLAAFIVKKEDRCAPCPVLEMRVNGASMSECLALLVRYDVIDSHMERSSRH